MNIVGTEMGRENQDKKFVRTEKDQEDMLTASELAEEKEVLMLTVEEVIQKLEVIEQVVQISDLISMKMLKIWIDTMLTMVEEMLLMSLKEMVRKLETRNEVVLDLEVEVIHLLVEMKIRLDLDPNLLMAVSILILSIL